MFLENFLTRRLKMTSINNAMPEGVSNYLNKAEIMAEDIIMPEKKFIKDNGYNPYYQTPSTYYHYDAGPGFWHTQDVHHYHHSEKKSNNKSENALLLGTALLVGTGLMLHSVGSEYSKLKNSQEDFKRFESDKKIALMDLHTSNVSPMSAYNFENITQIQRSILQDYQNDSASKLALKTGITTGLALGTYTCGKAFFADQYISEASPTIGALSLGLTVGGSLLWMFRSGLTSTDQSTKKKANDLLEAIQSFNYSTKA